jgi:hypothetical protein
MTAAKPFQTLRVMLFVLSAVASLAALVLIFAPSWLLSFAPGSVPPPNTTFEHALMEAFGIFALVLGYLLCVTARDPLRYAAVVDALIFLLLALAILNVYGLVALGLGTFYPAGYLVVRAIVQLTLAVVLFALRPKGAGGPLPAP